MVARAVWDRVDRVRFSGLRHILDSSNGRIRGSEPLDLCSNQRSRTYAKFFYGLGRLAFNQLKRVRLPYLAQIDNKRYQMTRSCRLEAGHMILIHITRVRFSVGAHILESSNGRTTVFGAVY